MKKILEQAFHTGVQPEMPRLKSRGIILSNIITLIAIVLCSIYFVYTIRNGWALVDIVVVSVILALCSILTLNRFGNVNISRGLLSIIIPLAAMLVILLPRFQHPESFVYVRSPGIFPLLLATSVFPALVFSRGERKLMIFCQSIHFLLFAGYDLLLRWL